MIQPASPTQTSQAVPTLSLDSSAPIAGDFSALLLALVGAATTLGDQSAALPTEVTDAQAAVAPAAVPVDASSTDASPADAASDDVADPNDCLAKLQAGASLDTAASQNSILDELNKLQTTRQRGTAKSGQTEASRVPEQLLIAALVPQPPHDTISAPAGSEPQLAIPAALAEITPRAILDDLKKFEMTVQHEKGKPSEQQPFELAEEALVTTDPIANIQQTQLPPRMITLQKVAVDIKPAERPKTQPSAPESTDAGTPAPSEQFADPTRTTDTIEQPRPAHQIEIPDLPKLQIVRAVSMEVGDPESQVIVRIEDRSSGMTLHLGAGNEVLHRTIESSVGSLMHALKQEQIQVSNIEVSRKSSIDKIRRMKETH